MILQVVLLWLLFHLIMREPQLRTGIQEHQEADLGFNLAVGSWVICQPT